MPPIRPIMPPITDPINLLEFRPPNSKYKIGTDNINEVPPARMDTSTISLKIKATKVVISNKKIILTLIDLIELFMPGLFKTK